MAVEEMGANLLLAENDVVAFRNFMVENCPDFSHDLLFTTHLV
jgi:hypothetical protein